MGFGWNEDELPKAKKKKGSERRPEKIRALADCKPGDIVQLDGPTEYRLAWFSGKAPHRMAMLYPAADGHINREVSNLRIVGEARRAKAVRLVP